MPIRSGSTWFMSHASTRSSTTSTEPINPWFRPVPYARSRIPSPTQRVSSTSTSADETGLAESSVNTHMPLDLHGRPGRSVEVLRAEQSGNRPALAGYGAAGRAELGDRAPCPRCRSQRLERLACGPQYRLGLGPAVVATQPFPIEKFGPRPIEGGAGRVRRPRARSGSATRRARRLPGSRGGGASGPGRRARGCHRSELPWPRRPAGPVPDVRRVRRPRPGPGASRRRRSHWIEANPGPSGASTP